MALEISPICYLFLLDGSGVISGPVQYIVGVGGGGGGGVCTLHRLTD